MTRAEIFFSPSVQFNSTNTIISFTLLFFLLYSFGTLVLLKFYYSLSCSVVFLSVEMNMSVSSVPNSSNFVSSVGRINKNEIHTSHFQNFDKWWECGNGKMEGKWRDQELCCVETKVHAWRRKMDWGFVSTFCSC